MNILLREPHGAGRIFSSLTHGMTFSTAVGDSRHYGNGALNVRVSFSPDHVAFVDIDFNGRRVFEAFAGINEIPKLKIYSPGPWVSLVGAASAALYSMQFPHAD